MGLCPHCAEKEIKVLITRASVGSETQVFLMLNLFSSYPPYFSNLHNQNNHLECLLKIQIPWIHMW